MELALNLLWFIFGGGIFWVYTKLWGGVCFFVISRTER